MGTDNNNLFVTYASLFIIGILVVVVGYMSTTTPEQINQPAKPVVVDDMVYGLSPELRIACNEYGVAYYVYRFKPAELLAPVISPGGHVVTCDEYFNDLKNGVIDNIK